MVSSSNYDISQVKAPDYHKTKPAWVSIALSYRIKILARNKTVANEELDPVLKAFLSHPDNTIDLALKCCQHLNDNARLVLCERAMKSLLDKYSNSSQVSRVYAKRFEYGMARLENDEAIDFARDFLREIQTIQNMDQQSKMCVQMLMWKRAEVCDENVNLFLMAVKSGPSEERHRIALYLFSGISPAVVACKVDHYSWSHLPLCQGGNGNCDDVKANMAKLLRNRSACMLSLGNIAEAQKSAAEAVNLEPDNVRSDYALFAVAMHQGNEAEAMNRIGRVAEKCTEESHARDEEPEKSDISVHGLICLCAQIAFEKENLPIALKALQSIQKTATNRTAKLIALKCLVRLILKRAQDSTNESEITPDLYEVLNEAHVAVVDALQVLVDISKHPLNDSEVESRRETALSSQTDKIECAKELIQDEADWFMKICWNMAIEAKSNPRLMKSLFHCCYKFLCLLQEDDAILTRQKTCLLMSCAASLELAKGSMKIEEMNTCLRFSLEKISQHKSVCARLLTLQSATSVREDKETLLRSLYELEAKLKLSSFGNHARTTLASPNGCEDLEKLISWMMRLPQVTTNTLETMAALCIEPPANHIRLSKIVLREAIARLSLQIGAGGDNELIAQLSKRVSMFYRTVIELTLRQGTGIDCESKDEALVLLREVLDFIEEKLKDTCPEQELLWFMVNGWNVGARLYAADSIDKAEKWLSTSMRFLVHLKQYRAGYEHQMNQTYMEVIERKDGAGQGAKRMEIS